MSEHKRIFARIAIEYTDDALYKQLEATKAELLSRARISYEGNEGAPVIFFDPDYRVNMHSPLHWVLFDPAEIQLKMAQRHERLKNASLNKDNDEKLEPIIKVTREPIHVPCLMIYPNGMIEHFPETMEETLKVLQKEGKIDKIIEFVKTEAAQRIAAFQITSRRIEDQLNMPTGTIKSIQEITPTPEG